MTDRCPTCGAKMVQYKHTLNQPLVKALRQLAQVGGSANIAEIGLTHNQVCNFQKLRYFGLAEKADDDGCWVVTSLGYQFLSGAETVPKNAVTYHGQTVRHDGALVGVLDYLETTWWRREDYRMNSEMLSDDNGKLF